jgi:hypothetical protein
MRVKNDVTRRRPRLAAAGDEFRKMVARIEARNAGVPEREILKVIDDAQREERARTRPARSRSPRTP